jgi:hypothetical protein
MVEFDSLHGILIGGIASVSGALVYMWRWSVARIEAQAEKCAACNAAQEKRVDEIYGMVIQVIRGATSGAPSDG